MKKTLYRILCFLLALSLISVPAFADINLDKPLSICVKYLDSSDSSPVKNVPFDLYFVAGVNESRTEFPLTEAFSPFAAEITNLTHISELNSEQLKILAGDLAALVQSRGIEKADSGLTDSDGICAFPSATELTLAPGIYLLTAQNCSFHGSTYTTAPVFVMLPYQESDSSQWIYDAVITPKFTKTPEDDSKLSLTVTKKWDMKQSTSAHPAQVTVHLNRGGKVFDTVTLKEENQWTFVWDNLDQDKDWSITEEPVENFSASIERVGNTFVVTNTISSVPPDSPNPDDHDEPLPKTGVLWWPIPLLLLLGIGFLILGLELKKNRT